VLPRAKNVVKTRHASRLILCSTPRNGLPIMALADYRGNRV